MKNRRALEAIAEAIVKYSGYLNPESAVYFARNPGGLRAFKPQHEKDEFGNRIFDSVLDGLQALFWDVELKMSGKSRARLTPESTLVDLASAYNQPFTAAQCWAKYLRHALRDESISHKTPISHFSKE